MDTTTKKNKPTREYVCQYIDAWMKENDVSNRKMAEALNISDVSVRRWRLGECAPDLNLLEKVCDFMDISIAELLGQEKAYVLSSSEKELIRLYRKDKDFKSITKKYKGDERFKALTKTALSLINDGKK